MKHIWTAKTALRPTENQRVAERRAMTLPARLTWKDQRGTIRFASVVTRDVSDHSVYIESSSVLSIPLYRLVQFQIEHQAREADALPDSLRNGRILSVVYRVSPPTQAGARPGLALRLMVDPKRRTAEISQTRATA